MDSLTCNVIYVNRNIGEDRLVRARIDDPASTPAAESVSDSPDHTRQHVQPLLDAFGDG